MRDTTTLDVTYLHDHSLVVEAAPVLIDEALGVGVHLLDRIGSDRPHL